MALRLGEPALARAVYERVPREEVRLLAAAVPAAYLEQVAHSAR
jgi:hypothetical protein